MSSGIDTTALIMAAAVLAADTAWRAIGRVR